MEKKPGEGRYLIITGGVGGAKLALGLACSLEPDEVLFAVNTGDDFEHLGLSISPDLDTLVYTLADMNNKEAGWGRNDETWHFMEALEQLGGPTWFKLGDRDLALHTTRSRMLAEGATLSEATTHICDSFGIRHPVVPMSNDPVRTTVHTEGGELSFQHYFVRDRCQPRVTGFEFKGIEAAVPQPEILICLENARGVIICPSNPFVSVDPPSEFTRHAKCACKKSGTRSCRVSDCGWSRHQRSDRKNDAGTERARDSRAGCLPLPGGNRRICPGRTGCCAAQNAGGGNYRRPNGHGNVAGPRGSGPHGARVHPLAFELTKELQFRRRIHVGNGPTQKF